VKQFSPSTIKEFFHSHGEQIGIIATSLSLFSLITFLISLFLIPKWICLLPEDYLTTKRNTATNNQPRLVLKNFLGTILILLGVAMLFLPGQGLLCIFLGLTFCSFPKKQKLERWILNKCPPLF